MRSTKPSSSRPGRERARRRASWTGLPGLVSTGTTTLDRIAAITFTEAAASELRDRVRDKLEESAADQELSDQERELCARGVQDLDHASIQTLHSFAGSILRERPIEAGLPPLFETMDAIASDIAFDEAWSAWIESTLDGDGDRPELEEALSLGFVLGLTVDNLKDVALRFYQNYDLLDGVVFEDAFLPPASAIEAITEAAGDLERLCEYSDLRDEDRLFNHVQGKLGSIRRLSEMDPRVGISLRNAEQNTAPEVRYGEGSPTGRPIHTLE